MRKTIFLTLFTLAISLLKANTIIVQNTNNSGSGSLRQATIDAINGDTIKFNPSLIIAGNDTIKLITTISTSKSLVFKGLYNSTDTLFISGNNNVRIFNINLTNDTIRKAVFDSMFLIDAYSSANGGALNFIGEFLEIKNSLIRNCTANYNGGAIFAKDDDYSYFSNCHLSIENVIIDNNTTISGWGGGISLMAQEEASLFLENVIIKNNKSFASGAGIFCYSNVESTRTSINNSKFINNESTSDGGGICIRTISKSSSSIDSSYFNIYNSEISNNKGVKGGGIHLYLNSYYDYTSYLVNIEDCIIKNNESQDNGGGIYIYTNSYSSINYPKVEISRSSISENISLESGAGIYLESPWTVQASCYLTVLNSSISNNNASKNGGGIFSKSYYAYMNIVKSTIDHNTAQENGGGIYSFTYYSHPFTDYSVSINTSTITSNHADSLAGGIYAEAISLYDTILSINNSTIVENTAVDSADGIFNTFTIFSSPNSSKVQMTIFSSIIALNGEQNIVTDSLFSKGFNIFEDSVIYGSRYNDQLSVDSTELDLGILSYHGGITKTRIPSIISYAINKGDTNDLTDAQNGAIADSMKDVGAAEYNCYHYISLISESCENYTSPSRNYEWSQSGTYQDTLTNILGCDTIITINLTINHLDSSISQNGMSIIANQANATYQWIDCGNNNIFISGENNQVFLANSNGSYAVIINNGICVDTSACVTIATTNLEKLQIMKDIIAYPNPTNGEITIILDEKIINSITIFNSIGSVINQFNSSNQKEIIDLSNYKNGLYFITVSNQYTIRTDRVIKQ